MTKRGTSRERNPQEKLMRVTIPPPQKKTDGGLSPVYSIADKAKPSLSSSVVTWSSSRGDMSCPTPKLMHLFSVLLPLATDTQK